MRFIACLLIAASLGITTVNAQKLTPKLRQDSVEIFDFQEITLSFKKTDPKTNPFKDQQTTVVFEDEKGGKTTVHGFCDAPDGSVYKVRFMPTVAGLYRYQLNFTQSGKVITATGMFTAKPSKRRGCLRVDPQHPWHFKYDNTGEHYFWNSTTTYWLMGWKDEKVIRDAITRLAGYGINRIRVGINARAHGGTRWNEPTVTECPQFTFKLNPWIAARPDDLDDPGFDTGRMNVPYWQKLDRLVAFAREKGIVVSLIFYVDGLDHGCDPFKKANMGNEDEQLYYRYAAARFGGYENIMWDIANEYHLFRTTAWAEKMGNYLKSVDPARHLISVHGNADFPFRKSPWVDVVLYQSWDECGGYLFMTAARIQQMAAGRILPQINEEYGYEDHYPPWGCGATAAKTPPDGRSAINRSQLAWEICMAGGYQTTGERADFGTGGGADTGGGWINGRGNDKMTMLGYYQIMKQTFEMTEYWTLEPRNDLVSYGNLCLADENRGEYLIYTRVQHCRIQLPPEQRYSVTMIDPITGERQDLPEADSDTDNHGWQYRQNLTGNRVFILKRKAQR